MVGFDLEAHRGGRDARPENTLFAFAYAMELGVQTLEMDMQLTKDGHIVISHNPVMHPSITKGPDGKYVKAGQYDIRTMTLTEIKQFDVGSINPNSTYFKYHGKNQLAMPGTRIPTLEEVFDLTIAYNNNSVTFNLETKSYADPAHQYSINNADSELFVNKFNTIINKYRMHDRIILQSFDWRTLKIMKQLNPNITLAALSCEQPSWGYIDGCYLKIGDQKPSPWLGGLNINDYNGNFVQAAKAIGADIVSPYWKELTPQLVIEAHQLKMKVLPWTVNKAHNMNMLIDIGVDGIISDKPYVLRNVLLNKGFIIPKATINTNNPYHTGTSLAVYPNI